MRRRPRLLDVRYLVLRSGGSIVKRCGVISMTFISGYGSENKTFLSCRLRNVGSSLPCVSISSVGLQFLASGRPWNFHELNFAFTCMRFGYCFYVNGVV